MAIAYIDVTFNSGVSTQVDDKGWITATARREYNVFTTTPQDNDSLIRLSASLPKEKSRHPYYIYLFCDSVDIQRQGPRNFVYSANYKSAPYKDPDNPQSPLNEPTQISYFTISSEGACEEDIDGNPITTKCGELVYGITRPYSDLGIRLTKNFITFDPPSFYLFINAVNQDTFLGFPPGTLWIANIGADEQFFDDVPYWKVTVEIQARKPYRTTNDKAWYVRFRHQGYRAFQQIGSQVVVAKVLHQGEPVTSPVLLDEDGYQIPDNPNSEPTAVWLEKKIYESKNFADMGF